MNALLCAPVVLGFGAPHATICGQCLAYATRPAGVNCYPMSYNVNSTGVDVPTAVTAEAIQAGVISATSFGHPLGYTCPATPSPSPNIPATATGFPYGYTCGEWYTFYLAANGISAADSTCSHYTQFCCTATGRRRLFRGVKGKAA
jgi:hypothetical protein